MNKETKDRLNQLKSNKNEMISLLDDWSNVERKARPKPDAWNALQVVEHVIGSEQGTLAYMKKKTQSDASALDISGEETDRESMKLNRVLQSTERYNKPQILPDPTGEYPWEAYKHNWDELTKSYWDFFENLDEEYYDKQIFKHPFSGRLNAYQTLDFLIHHITHHMHQLERIAKTNH